MCKLRICVSQQPSVMRTSILMSLNTKHSSINPIYLFIGYYLWRMNTNRQPPHLGILVWVISLYGTHIGMSSHQDLQLGDNSRY